MRNKSKATIDDEAMQAAEIAKAHEFAAFLRIGPHEKYRENGFASYGEARAAGDRLEAQHSRNCKQAIIYAINRLGSFPCTPDLAAMAGQIKAAT